MMKRTNPNYKIIFLDILKKKYPDKLEEGLIILSKEIITTGDVIKVNDFIFDRNNSRVNQKYKCYTRNDIFYILNYQEKYKLNNTQVSRIFNLSRNTIAKWKKIYII